MSDLVKIQDDVTAGLLSFSALDRINVVQERRLRLTNQLALDGVWQTPRKGVGRFGCGIIVEMPAVEEVSQSAPGPQDRVVLPILVVEEPDANMVAGVGTELDAETVARLVRMFLHQWTVFETGEFYSVRNAIEPVKDLPGLVAYRVTLNVILADTPLTRVTLPEITETDGVVSFTNNTAGAAIWYTTNGSAPAPSNAAASAYVDPFPVGDGTVIRYAAFKSGLLPSAFGQATITLT